MIAAAAWDADAWAIRGAGVAVVAAHRRRGRRWSALPAQAAVVHGRSGVERCGRVRAESERRGRKLRVGRRRRRACERGSGGGCVGKRRREIEGKRRRLESGETERKKAGVRGQNTSMTGGTRDFL